MGRTIAIGDIHGCLPALDTLPRDDPDFTQLDLGAADEFAVLLSNGVRWLTLASNAAVL